MHCKTLISTLFFVLLLVSTTLASKDVAKIIDSLLSPESGYDKRFHPNSEGLGRGEPVKVGIEAAILDVYDFDELRHQVTMVMYLRHRWTDKRLAFDSAMANGVQHYNLDAEQRQRIWIPDTFIANERSVATHEFSTPNEFTRVQSNGSVLRSQKLTVTIGCELNLRWFPFDQNICSVDFESYGYYANELLYQWAKGPGGKPKIWISKETAQSVRHEITSFRGQDYYVELSAGNYSRVGLELYFKRLSFRYLLDVYFPATAIPVVAFITLCVGPLHFRVLLSTICMAAMVIYAAILMTLTPKVDYKTALDFYVFNSSVTVFNVVLVNFLIYYLLKPKQTPSQMRMRQLNGSSEDGKGILSDEDGTEEPTPGTSSTPRFPNKSQELLYKLSVKSYLTMPLFFVAFNLIYWPVVLIASSGTPEDFIPVEARG